NNNLFKSVNLINHIYMLHFLFLPIGAGGWSPLISDAYQRLEVDLGERTKITAVATQGRYGSSDWLTSYLLMFSDTGHNWKQYRQEDSLGSFPGNSNADSVVQHKLQQPAVARFLRLIPLDWNPSGRIGLRVETYGCPYSESHPLTSKSSDPGLEQKSKEVVSLEFKTMKNSGMLLHAEGQHGFSLSLELDRGKLLLLLRQASGPPSEPRRLASLGSLLDDQHWHHVALDIRQVRRHKHNKKLSVGASQRPDFFKENFHGCLENLLYHDLNLIELSKHRDPQTSLQGNVSFFCPEPTSVAVTFPEPQSFLQLPWSTSFSSGTLSIGFQFRTWNKAGLLITFDLPQQKGVVWLYLSEAKICFQIHKAGRKLLEINAGSALNDGQWHSVDFISRHGHLTVSVDKDKVTLFLFFFVKYFCLTLGFLLCQGCPGEGQKQECRNPFEGFQGCMRLITLDNQLVNLITVQQRLLGNYSQLQIDMCGITDRCSPSHCEHGGVCTQSWTAFQCNCSDSGYNGATCHSSVFESSCEAYKHNGNTSGYFYIDVDGSGPIKPQLVFCNMTEENTWLVIQHNNSELTRVRSSPGVNQQAVRFEYPAEEEQLLAVIRQSEHCQQELSYHCRKSRLLNTQEGSPFSWWLGGPSPGRVQTYWGGAHPGSQQCACGLQGNCVDLQHYCNCDADRSEWTEDSGLVTHKGNLPVRSLVLGDVQRPGSEAAYRVGPLRCRGDKNFWNAAFFDKETSYLHFPTFHGELSADISFLFKTTASSGVFLENLGIKDFIRIELISSQVVFSFDVGNGPREVSVYSSVPLNDNRWHQVQAKRNVKEASLQLDGLPVVRQQAPADGHFHLQLNSQLFIGGTASRQKGFRGCIRSLQLNGATLDLEERAKITPGVRPGCPGHCSSYGSLCHHQGRCVEKDNGFHCDCSQSAYSGVFCQTEVSAIFKPETSISYIFKEPFEFSRNSSTSPLSISSNMPPKGEDISLSFRTTQSPALLLLVSSVRRQYLTLLINMLEVRYKLDSSQEAEVLRSGGRSLADGQLHSLHIRRLTDSVVLKNYLARLGSLGYSGCLSVVRFNSVSPLKAALLHPNNSPVVISGPLVQSSCGSAASANPYAAENTNHLSDDPGSMGSGQPLVNAMKTDSVLIGGVIAVVIFVVMTILAITARFLYRRKETYHSQEVKEVKQEDSQDFHYNHQADSHSVSGENPKEFFL
uniref:Contactin associated protein like 3 n=1 Tax=Oryzias latipes TaxID=8090 RepID=A0A3P9JAD1_ORYLA